MASDEYKTILKPSAEGLFKAKGSKFYGYAFPVIDEEGVATFVKTIQDQHHKARHHCYAYRIGLDGDRWRANDDGEPSSSAGKPILGQIDSFELTDVLVVVVRYFGGTKLGVSGLIEAYREGAIATLSQAEIIEKVQTKRLRIETDYAHLSDLMNAVKGGAWEITKQVMETSVSLTIAHRKDGFQEALTSLWLVLAKAYPGDENLEEDPAGYTFELLD
jgi:uncharacterized YigZ family protein